MHLHVPTEDLIAFKINNFDNDVLMLFHTTALAARKVALRCSRRYLVLLNTHSQESAERKSRPPSSRFVWCLFIFPRAWTIHECAWVLVPAWPCMTSTRVRVPATGNAWNVLNMVHAYQHTRQHEFLTLCAPQLVSLAPTDVQALVTWRTVQGVL